MKMAVETKIMMHITEVRTGAHYQNAVRKIHLAGCDDVRAWAAHKSCSEYADLRIVIGSWERISNTIFCADADEDKVFPCAPVALMWDLLEPAIVNIRKVEGVKNYAKQFEALKDKYNGWVRTDKGKDFSTSSDQTICAMFG